MKQIGLVLAALSVPIVCVTGAIFVMLGDHDGWGWLLVIAALTSSVKIGSRDA